VFGSVGVGASLRRPDTQRSIRLFAGETTFIRTSHNRHAGVSCLAEYHAMKDTQTSTAAMRVRSPQMRSGQIRSQQMRAGQRLPQQMRAGQRRTQQMRG